jgi:hypothetical protein
MIIKYMFLLIDVTKLRSNLGDPYFSYAWVSSQPHIFTHLIDITLTLPGPHICVQTFYLRHLLLQLIQC